MDTPVAAQPTFPVFKTLGGSRSILLQKRDRMQKLLGPRGTCRNIKLRRNRPVDARSSTWPLKTQRGSASAHQNRQYSAAASACGDSGWPQPSSAIRVRNRHPIRLLVAPRLKPSGGRDRSKQARIASRRTNRGQKRPSRHPRGIYLHPKGHCGKTERTDARTGASASFNKQSQLNSKKNADRKPSQN